MTNCCAVTRKLKMLKNISKLNLTKPIAAVVLYTMSVRHICNWLSKLSILDTSATAIAIVFSLVEKKSICTTNSSLSVGTYWSSLTIEQKFDAAFFSVVAAGARLALPVAYYTITHGAYYALPKVFTRILPTVTLCAAISVIVPGSPRSALLSLISIFFNTVLLYLVAHAEFLALVFLIVYVGAIAILFLFVIRLLNVKELSAVTIKKTVKTTTSAQVALLAAAATMLGTLANLDQLLITKTFLVQAVAAQVRVRLRKYIAWSFSDVKRFSSLLYTYYNALFSLTALLLLVAMLGAIILSTATVSKISYAKNLVVKRTLFHKAERAE